jgi:hypothetical protein
MTNILNSTAQKRLTLIILVISFALFLVSCGSARPVQNQGVSSTSRQIDNSTLINNAVVQNSRNVSATYVDSQAKEIGSSGCSTRIERASQKANVLILTLQAAKNCEFKTLDLIIGGDTLHLAGVDGSFSSNSNGAYTWRGNVRNADVYFSGNRVYTATEIASLRLHEPLCYTRGCLNSPNSARAQASILGAAAPSSMTPTANVPNSAACANAQVPNPNPLPDESIEYFGACHAGKATTGIVVWKVRGTPVNISCLSNGQYVKANVIDGFEPCEPYWRLVPNFCKTGSYKGQCQNGVPNGVGFQSNRGGTIIIRKGMFTNGKLHGFGYFGSMSGCGPAGCSGSRVNDLGWFEKGEQQIHCTDYAQCMDRISGKSFVTYLAMPKTPEQLEQIKQLRGQGDFESALAAFKLTGDKNDLAAAKAKAKTKAQNAQYEFALMRVAGYDKMMHLNAQVLNNNKSVDITDSQRLLSFMRNVDSKVPIRVKWSIGSDKTVLPLQYGSYKITLSIGLNADVSVRTCLFNFCQDRTDVSRYIKSVEAIITASNRHQTSGVYDLSIDGTGTSVVFGVHSANMLEAVHPVIRVESVELLP